MMMHVASPGASECLGRPQGEGGTHQACTDGGTSILETYAATFPKREPLLDEEAGRVELEGWDACR